MPAHVFSVPAGFALANPLLTNALQSMLATAGEALTISDAAPAAITPDSQPAAPAHYDTKADMLEAQQQAEPAGAVAGVKGPSDMRDGYTGLTLRSNHVDKVLAEFRQLPYDTDRNIIEEIIPLARPSCANPKPAIIKAKAIFKWVTQATPCPCTHLDWLDDEESVTSFFTEKIGSNGVGSKRQHADALCALYLTHDKRDAARQWRYYRAYLTYKQQEAAPSGGSKEVTAAQLANTPTMADIEQATEQADTQGRAFVALGTKVQGRCQNYVITPCVRLLDGSVVHYHDRTTPVERVGDHGYPSTINAYVVPEDGALPPVYVQNVYKTARDYGMKVAVIDPDTHALVMAWLAESPNTAALFLDTKGAPVHGSSEGHGDTVASLCRRIFTAVCGKSVTPGLIRRACANTKEMRDAISYVMEGAHLRNHSLLMEMTSGHYAFKGPASS